MIDFKKVNSVYFIGIGGIGVSAIARMFLLENKEVHGSDLSESEITEELQKLGAKITIGQGVELIPEGIDLIIYTVAIEKYAVDFLAQIKALAISSLSYPQALHEISNGKYTIAVAGTHGKTTTTAMIAKILIDAGLDPTVIVGSLLQGSTLDREKGRTFGTNFIAGKSKYLVVEADEYRRGFLNLTPSILVITVIDEDHLDYFKDLSDIQSAFKELIARMPLKGIIIANKENRNVVAVLEGLPQKILFFETPALEEFTLLFPGEHNRRNAAAALHVATELGIEREKVKIFLAAFQGTARRFEYKGKMKSGALVYDDYAHNPQKISALIQGVREKYPNKTLTVVFQPHLYSRTKDHLDAFAESLSVADHVILAPIFPAREKFDPSISSRMLAEKIRPLNENVRCLDTFEMITDDLEDSTSRDGVVVTVGAGDIY